MDLASKRFLGSNGILRPYSTAYKIYRHSGVILCMCVTRESQYLLTGSEDTTVIVWDLHTLAIKTKILEHIAPVLCVAAIVNRSLVISGGEDSAVIVTSLVHAMEITDDNVFLVTLQTENELHVRTFITGTHLH
ncbi:Uncharacterized protein OBRU01_03484, partial [Operophtera brumata]